MNLDPAGEFDGGQNVFEARLAPDPNSLSRAAALAAPRVAGLSRNAPLGGECYGGFYFGARGPPRARTRRSRTHKGALAHRDAGRALRQGSQVVRRPFQTLRIGASNCDTVDASVAGARSKPGSASRTPGSTWTSTARARSTKRTRPSRPVWAGRTCVLTGCRSRSGELGTPSPLTDRSLPCDVEARARPRSSLVKGARRPDLAAPPWGWQGLTWKV